MDARISPKWGNSMIEEKIARHRISVSGDTDGIYLDYQKVQSELQNVKLEQKRDRAELEKAIERSNAMTMKAEVANIELGQIINTSIDGMFLVYEDFTVKRINKTLLTFLDMSEADALGKKCYDLMACSWCGTAECCLERLLKGQTRIELDVNRTRKNGLQVPFLFTATPFKGIDGAVIGMVALFKDITERKYAENTLKEANERLELLSSSDGLTQVANRRCFDQTLEREWNRLKRTKEPLSLIMCDVDFFKLYNDSYGHQSGDDCLRSVAAAMSETARRGGDFIARYGGEEFVVVLPGTETKGALNVAENIRHAIERLDLEHSKSQVAPLVTLSLGVATVIPCEEGTPELLIKCADQALYTAKSSGRNCVIAWECSKNPSEKS
jgi:diguanylate cyclase (GGDEF)-like protein/PAS domain S-box-containing protein